MKFNKSLSLLVGLVMITSLASCNRDDTSNPGNNSSTNTTQTTFTTTTTTSNGNVHTTIPALDYKGGYITEPTTIEVWTTMGKDKQPWMEQMVKAFEELEPNVTVKHTPQSGNYDSLKEQITTGASTGNYPNMAYCYPDHVADYFDYRLPVNLKQYADNPEYGWDEFDRSDIYEGYLQEGYNYNGPQEGGLYSVPFAKSSELMYYNTKILGRTLEGYDRPLQASDIENITWDEFFNKLCPALLKYDKDEKAAGRAGLLTSEQTDRHAILGYDSGANFFITLCEQYGIDYTKISEGHTNKGELLWKSEEGYELGEMIYDWCEKGYIVTPESVGQTFTSSLFQEGSILFTISSTAGYSHIATQNVEVGCAMIPQAEVGLGVAKKTISQGPSFVVLDRGNETENLACWLFYKFITEPVNNLSWSGNSGYFPIRKCVANSDLYLAIYDPESYPDHSDKGYIGAITFEKTDELANSSFTSPVFDRSSDSRNAVQGVVNQICLGARSSQAGDDVAGFVKDIIDEQYEIAIAG